MIFADRHDARLRGFDANASREAVLAWVRSIAPDVRIRRARTPSGARACAALFTFGGEELVVEAVEGEDGIADADDAIVRRCAWLLRRRMGLPVETVAGDRQRLEEAIVAAAAAGNTESADALGRELAFANASQPLPAWRTGLEPMGGSMFTRSGARFRGDAR